LRIQLGDRNIVYSLRFPFPPHTFRVCNRESGSLYSPPLPVCPIDFGRRSFFFPSFVMISRPNFVDLPVPAAFRTPGSTTPMTSATSFCHFRCSFFPLPFGWFAPACESLSRAPRTVSNRTRVSFPSFPCLHPCLVLILLKVGSL